MSAPKKRRLNSNEEEKNADKERICQLESIVRDRDTQILLLRDEVRELRSKLQCGVNLFHLPSHIISTTILPYLTFQDIGRLDTACCSHSQRSLYLECVKDAELHCSLPMNTKLQWLLNRNVAVTDMDMTKLEKSKYRYLMLHEYLRRHGHLVESIKLCIGYRNHHRTTYSYGYRFNVENDVSYKYFDLLKLTPNVTSLQLSVSDLLGGCVLPWEEWASRCVQIGDWCPNIKDLYIECKRANFNMYDQILLEGFLVTLQNVEDLKFLLPPDDDDAVAEVYSDVITLPQLPAKCRRLEVIRNSGSMPTVVNSNTFYDQVCNLISQSPQLEDVVFGGLDDEHLLSTSVLNVIADNKLPWKELNLTYLRDPELIDSVLNLIRNCGDSLRKVYLPGDWNCTSDSFKPHCSSVIEMVFKNCHSIEQLEFNDPCLIDDAILRLWDFPNAYIPITELQLVIAPITDSGLQIILQSCPLLEILRLGDSDLNCEIMEKEITGSPFCKEGLHLPHLKSLRLQFTLVSSTTLRGILDACPMLYKLDVYETQISDDLKICFEGSRVYSNLKSFNIACLENKVPFNMVFEFILHKLPNLTTLALDVDDFRAVERIKFPKLQTLLITKYVGPVDIYRVVGMNNHALKYLAVDWKEDGDDVGWVGHSQRAKAIQELIKEGTLLEISAECCESIAEKFA